MHKSEAQCWAVHHFHFSTLSMNSGWDVFLANSRDEGLWELETSLSLIADLQVSRFENKVIQVLHFNINIKYHTSVNVIFVNL